jgi:CHAT domain-containing protein
VAHPDDVAAIAARAPWGDATGDADDSWQPVFAAMMVGAVERSNPGDLLWIVPCGPLHQMPLHATRVGEVPLLERNPVCYSSSASILPVSLERSRGTYASAIVFGDSRNDLPFARAESLAVAASFGVQAVVGDAATEDAFNDLLEAAGDSLDVLHLATHGTFDADNALDSGLELAGYDGSTSRLTAREIVRATLPIDIVTLSACESGRTRVFAGDEPVGLTRAFLTAGASAVLATLWLTNDLSTRLIVERFYEALRGPGGTSGTRWRRAQALREASMAVRAMTVRDLLDHQDANVVSFAREMAAARALQGGDHPFSAPRYWAPFALVGAWT